MRVRLAWEVTGKGWLVAGSRLAYYIREYYRGAAAIQNGRCALPSISPLTLRISTLRAGWESCRGEGREHVFQPNRSEPAAAMTDYATSKAPIPLKPSPQQSGPQRKRPSRAEAEDAVRTLIAWTGDDPAREGLRDTPRRVADAYGEYFSGYRLDPVEALSRTFDEAAGYDDLVMLRDIRVESHCEHHMTPFIGVAHVAYLPNGRIVGISKIARVVEIFGKRLQTQETMTAQIADAIEAALRPRGVAVLIEAEHQCMSMRGVHQPGVRTITSRFTGALQSDASYRDRFLQMVHGPRI
jgi:GTP cyclohydrolase IA